MAQNTCCFDSIPQLCAVAYVDSERYAQHLNNQPSSLKDVDIVRNIVHKGVSSKTYRIKGWNTKKYLFTKRTNAKEPCYDTEMAVSKMLSNAFPMFLSGFESQRCSSQICPEEEAHTLIATASIQPTNDSIVLAQRVLKELESERYAHDAWEFSEGKINTRITEAWLILL